MLFRIVTIRQPIISMSTPNITNILVQAMITNNEGHVAHNEHLDEGVMDFIICLLSETEHPSPSGDESFYFSAEETPRTSSLNINVLPSLAIEASMIHAVSQIEKTIHVNLIEGFLAKDCATVYPIGHHLP